MADRQYIDIPILGLDRRPSQRQAVPGLCEELHNLEPSGDPERPYWKAVPRSDEIRNEAGEPFRCDGQENIVAFGWHARSAIGKYSTYENPSLRRLVCLFSDGQLKVFDPDYGSGWEEVASKQYGEPADEFGGQFQTFNEALVLLININGQPGEVELLVDDKIIPFEFPEVPVVKMERLTEGYYSESEFEGETYAGLRGGAVYELMYALRLTDGTLVKHTSPFEVELFHTTGPGDEEGTYYFRFFLEGYESIGQPSNLDFWADYIQGVVVLCTDYKAPGGPKTHLKNEQFYEIASFDTIDPSDMDPADRIAEYDGRDIDIINRKQANVDNFSHHGLRTNVIDVFNSRLLTGGIQTRFAEPGLPFRVGNVPFALRARQTLGGTPSVSIRVFGINALWFEVSGSGVENIQTDSGPEDAGDFPTEITADIIDPDADYSISLSPPLDPTTNLNKDIEFSLTVAKEDFQADDWLDLSGAVGDDEAKKMKLVVEIEAGTGIYKVVQSGYSRYWDMVSGGLERIDLRTDFLTYPDRRAKSMELYGEFTITVLDPETEEQTEVQSWRLIKKIDLTPSDTHNFSYYPSNIVSTELPVDHVGLPDEIISSQYQPNQVRVSEVNDPFAFIASRTNNVGQGSGQKITAFATNSLPVSDGQFGHYPIYVFCEHSIYALEQSRDTLVAFERISPVSASHGCRGPRQVTNSGQAIVFLYRDGVYALRGTKVDSLSDPVGHYPERERLDFQSSVISSRRRGEDDEIHVCDGQLTYVYNLKYGRWYTTDKLRGVYASQGGVLYGMDSDGLIYNEDELLTRNPVQTTFSYRPVHFLRPEQLKRLFGVAIRGQQAGPVELEVTPEGSRTYSTHRQAMRLKHRSTHSFRVRCTGQMVPDTDLVEGITGQVESRYEHKNRQIA